MKNLITILLVLALVSVVGYLAMNHYQSYQQERETAVSQEQAQAESERQAQAQASEERLADMKKENERLMAECEKGEVAFSNLSAFYRANLDEPKCEEVKTVTE